MDAQGAGRDGAGNEGVGAVDPWIAEARAKKLPKEWVETLAASDGYSEAQKALIVAHVDNADDLAAKRAKAIEYGRRLGEQTANDLGQTGRDREQRIARAKAYAAWEFDGKPLSSKAQREEMGVTSPDIPEYADQVALWAKR